MPPSTGSTQPAEDVATVKSTLGRVSSPAILVGHSYGGSVITGAGTDDRVAGLVYIAALAPDADETSQTQQSNFPKTDVFSYIEVADGRIWLLPEASSISAGDLSEQEKKLVWATQGVPLPTCSTRKSEELPGNRSQAGTSSAKKTAPSIPIWSAHGQRMGATTYEFDSSHVPMLSQPERVIDVIRTAAKAVQARASVA